MSDCFRIIGGRRLDGIVHIQGAKNAVLPIMAASFLCRGTSVLTHVPDIEDVRTTIAILRDLGCRVAFEEGIVTIDSSDASGNRIDDSLMRRLRSSVIFLGAILSRAGEVHLSYPGGYHAHCVFLPVLNLCRPFFDCLPIAIHLIDMI